MRVAFLWCAAAALAACAPFAGSLKPGVSTEAQVRESLGPPAVEFSGPNGERQLFYPSGPHGTQTHKVSLRGDGVVASVEQVLADDRFRGIQDGVTTSEGVLRLIGPPWRRVRFDNLRQEAWDYLYQDSWGYLVDFSVMVDERGIVASKVNVRRDFGKGTVSR